MYLLLLLIVLLVLFGPGLWVKRVIARYAQPEDRYRHTGAEFARLLLDEIDLTSVAVEETTLGDHYDPISKTVRLSAGHYHQRSLSAIAIAAHEVGHAEQDQKDYAPFLFRTRIAGYATLGQKVGNFMFLLLPVMLVITRVPHVGLLFLLAGIMSLGLSTLLHLITLPVELDASFSRALPRLENGNYLHDVDYPHARRLLKAAAYTYVAGSLMSVLNIWRWLRLGRF
jgi:Zn-dependent membrane protease YugP